MARDDPHHHARSQGTARKEMTTAYLGIDPTADSLHIGHLVGVMILKHFQLCGHRPLALVGGATGMIGDPSGKSQERNLLDEKTLRHNQEAIKRQLAKLLDFESDAPNAAVMVNNYDWMKEFSFLDFIRDIGKVHYGQLHDGQGFGQEAFQRRGRRHVVHRIHLPARAGLRLSAPLPGHELQNPARRCRPVGQHHHGHRAHPPQAGSRSRGVRHHLPLITKADGTKFGKTESGNVWLDPRYTSPYKFYQFWLNVSDEDAKRYIRIFTLLDRETIETLIAEHDAAPHLRALQKRLAQEITTMIHSKEEYEKAVEALQRFCSAGRYFPRRCVRSTKRPLLQVFEGVPQFRIARTELAALPFIDLCAEKTQIFPSKGECRKLVQGSGVSLNKEKIADPMRSVTEADLLAGKYLLVQKGKKNYYLVIAE